MPSQITLGSRAVRVAVIGAGVMGRNHLRIFSRLKNVDLVGLYDPDPNAAIPMAAQFDCRAFASIDEIAQSVDAVSICSPSSTHGRVGLHFLDRGIHCLIEKPLATNEGDALAVIAAAKKTGAKLLVGHVERFNPAVQQVSALLSNGAAVHSLDARRLSSVGRRIRDVDVVADLMVHDLDIMTSLVREKVVSVTATATNGNGAESGDHVIALLGFSSGAVACLTASRITQNAVRKLSVTSDAGLIEVDYMNQSVEVYLQDAVKVANVRFPNFGEHALDIAMERMLVRRAEPLQLELTHFIDIIRNDGDPIVSGEQGLNALHLVWSIQECIREMTRMKA